MKLFFITAILAVLSFSGFAQAELSDGEFEFCQDYAKEAHNMAMLRDEGYTLEEIKELYEHQDDDTVIVKNAIAEYVFTYPHLSPKQEANVANEDCRATFY